MEDGHDCEWMECDWRVQMGGVDHHSVDVAYSVLVYMCVSFRMCSWCKTEVWCQLSLMQLRHGRINLGPCLIGSGGNVNEAKYPKCVE